MGAHANSYLLLGIDTITVQGAAVLLLFMLLIVALCEFHVLLYVGLCVVVFSSFAIIFMMKRMLVGLLCLYGVL